MDHHARSEIAYRLDGVLMTMRGWQKKHILSPIRRLMRCNDPAQYSGVHRMPLNFSWVFVTNSTEKCLDIREQAFYNWQYINYRVIYLDGKITRLRS